MQTDPLDAVNPGELFHQAGQAAFSVAVQAVIGRVLGHEDQFPHAAGSQPARLFHQILDRYAHMRTADERNGAIGTGAVAPFCNLEISIVGRRGENTAQCIGRQNTLPLIHFRNFSCKF